jgi:tetratricopeptide (TPR) repeat protein
MQFAFAQDIEPLLSNIAKEKNENLRVQMLFNFFSKIGETDPILSMKNAQKLLLYSQEKKDRVSEAYSIVSIAYNYRGLGNTEKSLEYALKADVIARETGNEILLAIINNVLGNIYKDLGNYPKALVHEFITAEMGSRQNMI